eukprot:CAMPEP_0201528944 /NCGR_PEP_ID=MMETSP0161_2-20130828/40101_1 /ASSEMBLY_ACC=CAM_ASM_000251 /TAXON_ID=180227 /ORGANISM="Neoparamoeba aestuarina, Strain SoJaBio B1-5/56/2" /LENGTH=188 /DNA_ID=CAMNT_0047930501 /DNA_START=70 /DNA_END=633 /DNA_ORIENTATION=-
MPSGSVHEVKVEKSKDAKKKEEERNRILQKSRNERMAETHPDKSDLKLVLYYTAFFVGLATFLIKFKILQKPALYQTPLWIMDDDDKGRWLLLQACYSKRFLDAVCKEFKERRTNNLTLTFSEFIRESYPSIFAGNQYEDADIMRIAAFAATRGSEKLQRRLLSVGRGESDTKLIIDTFVRKVLQSHP